MSKVFILGDTHFNHFNVWDKFEPIRKETWKSVDEMNWGIVNNWNSVVSPEDIVWHLGDVAFGFKRYYDQIKHLCHSLNGTKHLILGNHDRHQKVDDIFETFIDLGFEDVYDQPVYFEKYILSHEPIEKTEVLNVHGHLHSTSHHEVAFMKGREHLYYNASIEMLPDMKPVELDRVLSFYGLTREE